MDIDMEPILPSWFKYRQGKAETAGENMYRLSGPNLDPVVITIRKGPDDRWTAALLQDVEGPELAATLTGFDNPVDAWDAAFELFRQHIIY